MEADLTRLVLTALLMGTAKSRGKGTREEGGRTVMLHLRHLQTPETLINQNALCISQFHTSLCSSGARLSLGGLGLCEGPGRGSGAATRLRC